jgi:hypothetical protein
LRSFDKRKKSDVYCKASLITEALAEAVSDQRSEDAGAAAQAKQDKSVKTLNYFDKLLKTVS